MPKILKKINDYVIFIENDEPQYRHQIKDPDLENGESYQISEWQEFPSGKTFFCRSHMQHYQDITGQTKTPKMLVEIMGSNHLPQFSTLEELIEWMKEQVKQRKSVEDRKF